MSTDLFPTQIESAAGIDGQYRYWLLRRWDREKPHVCWVMLNPSTADAEQDDPTIRKCIGFAKLWGAGAITVVNLFAFRATDPKQLPKHYPIERHLVECNNDAIQTAAFNRMTVAAWGCDKAIGSRDKEVTALLKGQDVRALKVTKDGYPQHPLYVPYKAELVSYAGRGVAPANEQEQRP